MDLMIGVFQRTVPLDTEFMKTVYNYFNNEPYIGLVCDYLWENLLKYGVEIVVGPELDKHPIEYDLLKLKATLMKAFRHMLIFGFTLYTYDDNDYRQLVIPDMDRGVFYRVENNNEVQLQWKPGPAWFNMFGDETAAQRYEVFVWPGFMPDRNGQFFTPVTQLYSQYIVIDELFLNMLDADYNNSHPPLVTQPVRDARSLSEMTDSETILADRREPDLRETLRIKRTHSGYDDIERRMNLASGVNSKSYSLTFSKQTGCSFMRYRPRLWEMGGEYRLEEGSQLVPHTPPTYNRDLMDMLKEYQLLILKRLRVPDWVFHRETRFKVDEDKLNQELEGALDFYRDNVELFFNHANAHVNRDIENAVIAKDLIQADGASEDSIAGLAKSRYRVKLAIGRKKSVSLDLIAKVYSWGCITTDEFVSAVRQNIGFVDDPREVSESRMSSVTPVVRDGERRAIKRQRLEPVSPEDMRAPKKARGDSYAQTTPTPDRVEKKADGKEKEKKKKRRKEDSESSSSESESEPDDKTKSESDESENEKDKKRQTREKKKETEKKKKKKEKRKKKRKGEKAKEEEDEKKEIPSKRGETKKEKQS